MAEYRSTMVFFVEVNGQSLEFCDRQSALAFLQNLYQSQEGRWRINRSVTDSQPNG